MKNPTKFVPSLVFSLLLLLVACSGAPKQSKCSVQVYIPNQQFTEVRLLDANGRLIDSTLSIRNDSILFTRTDSLNMPYVAVLRMSNPEDTINFVAMPLVIEGGIVKLDLTDRISLSGTVDNEKMYTFLKTKNNFAAKYAREGNPEHDVKKLKEDYSKFYADQAIVNADNIVGQYIFDTYRSVMTPEDRSKVEQRIKTKN